MNLLSHRSIRKFLNQQIGDELLTEILKDGTCASNTGNMQLYSVVVTRDDVKKTQLAPLHFNQSMVMSAPLLLTVCFDIHRFYQWCKINNTATDFNNLLWLLSGTIDAAIFAQNICISAENHGLGICYLGTTLYNAEEISNVLNLPQGVIPITSLVIGFPDIIPELSDRLPLDAVVHYEKYSTYSDQNIQEIYAEKEQLTSSMNFVVENSKSNLAEVYTEVRYKTRDNLNFSSKLVVYLQKQGFLNFNLND
jgi:nitroreductase